MAGTESRASCGELCKTLSVPIARKFLLTLLPFVVNSMEKFKANSDIHNVSTRYIYNLSVPNTNHRKYKQVVYCTGLKLFSNLPPVIKGLNCSVKVFKQILKECPFSHFFYSVEEFTLTKISQLS
jgi:hypothetical protein